MPGVGTVWYYPEGAANILSGHRLVVNSGWSVKQDSDRYHQTGNTDDLSIRCVTKEGVRCKFKPTVDGLHVMDCEKLLKKGKHIFGQTITDNGTMHGEAMGSCHHIKAKADAHCFAEGVNKINNSEGIDTVQGSIARLSKRDQMRVLLTQRLQHVAGHPSDDTLICAAVTNSIMGCPIAREDVLMALEYLGKSGYAVAGKTTRTQPDEVVPNEALVELPPTILNYYKDVVLSIDILFVNRVPFIATISRNIHYGTIAALPNMKIETLEKDRNRVSDARIQHERFPCQNHPGRFAIQSDKRQKQSIRNNKCLFTRQTHTRNQKIHPCHKRESKILLCNASVNWNRYITEGNDHATYANCRTISTVSCGEKECRKYSHRYL